VVFGLADEPDLQSFDPVYLPYASRGFACFWGSDKKTLVNILRDSAALDSFLFESVLPFSSDSDSGGCESLWNGS